MDGPLSPPGSPTESQKAAFYPAGDDVDAPLLSHKWRSCSASGKVAEDLEPAAEGGSENNGCDEPSRRNASAVEGRGEGGGGGGGEGRGGERRMLGVFCTEAFSLRLPLGGCGGENVSGEESLGGRGGKACPFSGVSVPSVIVVQKLHCHRSKWWTLQVRVKCGGWSWSCCCLGRVRLML